MTDKFDLPKDPLTLGDELEAYLAVTADDEDSAYDGYEPTEEELAELEEVREVARRVAGALAVRGVELGTVDGEPDFDCMHGEDPFDRKYLASMVLNGVLDAGLLELAIAKISANPYLDPQDKAKYIDTVEELVGVEAFKAALEGMLAHGELEAAMESEQELQELGQSSAELRRLISIALVDRGVSPNHDDFEALMGGLVMAVNLRHMGAPQHITGPAIQKLSEQAVRLGIKDIQTDLFENFGLTTGDEE